jgi:hypothetical protein
MKNPKFTKQGLLFGFTVLFILSICCWSLLGCCNVPVRLKDVAKKQYTHQESELAAGKSLEILSSVRKNKPQMSTEKSDNMDDEEL